MTAMRAVSLLASLASLASSLMASGACARARSCNSPMTRGLPPGLPDCPGLNGRPPAAQASSTARGVRVARPSLRGPGNPLGALTYVATSYAAALVALPAAAVQHPGWPRSTLGGGTRRQDRNVSSLSHDHPAHYC